MNGNALPPYFIHRFKVDAAGVVGSIAQQYHRADGQVGPFRNYHLQRVTQVCRR